MYPQTDRQSINYTISSAPDVAMMYVTTLTLLKLFLRTLLSFAV